METIQAVSYGVVPYYWDEETIKYLLLEQYGIGRSKHWGFPKGRPEPNEAPIETARREFIEETGNNTLVIFSEPTYIERYSFNAPEGYVEKTVAYFVGRLDDMEIKIQEEEICAHKWLTYEDALPQFTYDNGRDLLQKAHTHLTKNTRQ